MHQKLTEDQVLEIIQHLNYGDRQKTIARDFGISIATVSSIATGKNWGYLSGYKESKTLEQLAEGKYFLPLSKYPGYYITVSGRVLRVVHGKASIKGTHPDEYGYETVSINNYPLRIHSLLCLTFKSESHFPGSEVRHIDGNPQNNDLDNLEWGTHLENCHDTVDHDRSLRGEKNANAKLTESEVHEIRALAKAGSSRSEIASRFSIHQMTVSRIVHGTRWGWLK